LKLEPRDSDHLAINQVENTERFTDFTFVGDDVLPIQFPAAGRLRDQEFGFFSPDDEITSPHNYAWKVC